MAMLIKQKVMLTYDMDIHSMLVTYTYTYIYIYIYYQIWHLDDEYIDICKLIILHIPYAPCLAYLPPFAPYLWPSFVGKKLQHHGSKI